MRGISRVATAVDSRTRSAGVEQMLFFVAIIAASSVVMMVIGGNLSDISLELNCGLTL